MLTTPDIPTSEENNQGGCMHMNTCVTKEQKCIICGRICESDLHMVKINGQLFNIDRSDCYLFYKRLLGIYGPKYLQILSRY
jgi:hypothetical protein